MTKNIILLHGWGAKTEKLAPLAGELEKLGWKTYIPKLAGFEKPAPSTVWGIKEYGDYVKGVAEEKFAGEKFYLFGHSFGGGIAIRVASGPPKNLSGAILCASRGLSRGKVVKRVMFSLLARAGKVFILVPAVGSGFKKLLYKAAREHDYEKLEGVMKDVFKKVISEDLKPYVKKIKAPVLVLWGEDDKMTPVSDAYYLGSVLKRVKLKVFVDYGHSLPYAKPKEVAKEIDLWRMSLLS